jgi:hypothetical protein
MQINKSNKSTYCKWKNSQFVSKFTILRTEKNLDNKLETLTFHSIAILTNTPDVVQFFKRTFLE